MSILCDLCQSFRNSVSVPIKRDEFFLLWKVSKPNKAIKLKCLAKQQVTKPELQICFHLTDKDTKAHFFGHQLDGSRVGC